MPRQTPRMKRPQIMQAFTHPNKANREFCFFRNGENNTAFAVPSNFVKTPVTPIAALNCFT